ncbi:Protein T2 [Physocladia obscura]|uniref:Protein T2 n=1 Tax=Physocladia obscura TaxID=109957 RepID=A0AAD5SSM8_9FUNG|nr:Protein T2 [Physocladia obscura]
MVLLAPHLIDAISVGLPDVIRAMLLDSFILFHLLRNTFRMHGTGLLLLSPGSQIQPKLLVIGYTVQEILVTEQSYFQELGIIINIIKKKLIDAKIITQFSINAIFGGIDELYDLHNKILDELLDACSLESWIPEKSVIGDIFLKHVQEFERAYVVYIDGKKNSDDTIEKEAASTENNGQFKTFLAQCLRSRETKFTDLKELLLRPMQRTTRYPLLLRELYKRTPDDHPDKEFIKEAVDTMSEIANKVDKKLQSIQHIAQLFQAQRETRDCPATLINDKRRCLMEMEAVDPKNSNIKYKLFLCSDLLMVTLVELKAVGGLFANRTPTVAAGGPGGPGSGGRRKFKFVRWIDLADISDTIDDPTTELLRIRMEQPGQDSLSTQFMANGQPFTLAVEFKMDTLAHGAAQRRGDFIRTLRNEIKMHKKKKAGEVVEVNNFE